ncbi:MAG: hypothetical protein K9H64_18670 [Bacteroidales bacterium]|nr:hypothetical protein [Bacteroidales bacterium]MCF8458080.1 hypothetical protein [Bacteroidales bacterium]
MKKAFVLIIFWLAFMFLPTLLSAKSDTLFYDSGAIKLVKDYLDDTHAKISTWYEDGKPVCQVNVYMNKDWYVDGPTTIFNNDGTIYQTYDHILGELCTYENSYLVSKTTVPLHDTICTVEEYFYSGQMKSYELSRHDTGRYCLALISSYNTERSYIYQQNKFQNILRKKYHPNGQLWVQEDFTGIPPYMYEKKYYFPSGELDTLTSKCHIRKCGIQYAYYNNGVAQSITNYYDGTSDRWYENGVHECSISIKVDQDKEVFLWYDSGQIKEHAFNRNDKLLGPYLSFHPNGTIEKIGTKYSIYGAEMMSCYNESGVLEWENIGLPDYSVGNQDFRNEAKEKSGFTYTGDFANGVRDGKWVSRYANGNICYEATYADSVLHGPFKLYYEDGQIMGTVNYDKGWMEGPYAAWGKDGKPLTTGDYRKMKKQGAWTTYFPNGNLERIAEFDNDKRTIVWEEHYENGTLSFINEKPKDGKQLSKNFYDDGSLSCIIIHDLNGGVDDKTFCRRDGSLDRTQKPKKGMPGVEVHTSYFPNGKKWAEVERIGRKRQGYCAIWNEQGIVLEEGYYVDDLKDGEWKSYDENGKLLVVQHFSKGTEQFQEKQEAETDCSCYEIEPVINSKSNMQSLELWVERDSMQYGDNRFPISRVVKNLFFEEYHRHSMVVYTSNDIEVPIQQTGGLVLDLTPCRKYNNLMKADVGYHSREYLEQEYDFNFDLRGSVTPQWLFDIMQQVYGCDYNYARLFKGVNSYFESPLPLIKFLTDSGYKSNLDSLENEEIFNKLFRSQPKNLLYDSWSIHQDLFKVVLEPELEKKSLDVFMNDFFTPMAAIPHEREVEYDYDSTYFETYYEYLPTFDEVVSNILPEHRFDIGIRYFGLKFPETLIIPAGEKVEQTNQVEALFPVSEFTYSTKNFGNIAYRGKATSCMPGFSIAQTGLTFTASQPVAILMMTQLARYTDLRFYPGLKNELQTFTDFVGRKHEIPYLEAFAGIYVDSVNITLQNKRKQVLLKGMDVIMDGHIISGRFKLISKEFVLEEIEEILIEQGFDIFHPKDIKSIVKEPSREILFLYKVEEK